MRALEALAERWELEAETLEHYREGAGAVARLHAAELKEALRESAGETLTIPEAALESGYSESRLRHLIGEGRLHNAGEKGRPRVFRGDIPSKPKPPDATPLQLTRFDSEVAAVLGKS